MSELVNKFLDKQGYIREKGETNAPLIPNIMADSLYLCWEEQLQGRLKQKSKKYANQMMKHYGYFNKRFFRSFSQEEVDKCVKGMDLFSEYISGELVLFRVAVKNLLPKSFRPEEKNMIAYIATCKLLACQANDIWGIIYKTLDGVSDRDKDLYSMSYNAGMLFAEYTNEIERKHKHQIGDVSNDPDIKLSIRHFESKVMAFISEWV